MVTPQAVRRWVLTGGIAATTITGTIYGAGLKSEQEAKQERKRVLEAKPEEVIAQLETARQELVSKRNALERKRDQVSARILEKKQAEEQKK